MKSKDALAAEWEARMADTVSPHAQQMAAAAAGYEARLENARRELDALQVRVYNSLKVDLHYRTSDVVMWPS